MKLRGGAAWLALTIAVCCRPPPAATKASPRRRNIASLLKLRPHCFMQCSVAATVLPHRKGKNVAQSLVRLTRQLSQQLEVSTADWVSPPWKSGVRQVSEVALETNFSWED
ncbi:hypothetical protein QBC34DRAFT_413943 [Podospora aff. communis PSN243]|uniref:Secreted protein n=1 Tax=Podospora aff. communis PSN243 TaxID=3040156 RepID=A0AAV9G8N5_9PEZI|nr:hypothetical protein QBC34DRAFT_413943 [Podospora aff. communis PSN243]